MLNIDLERIAEEAAAVVPGTVVQTFLDRGYRVVGNARSLSSESFTPAPNLALVEGDIGLATTAEKPHKSQMS
jgi:hypothetical protein